MRLSGTIFCINDKMCSFDSLCCTILTDLSDDNLSNITEPLTCFIFANETESPLFGVKALY